MKRNKVSLNFMIDELFYVKSTGLNENISWKYSFTVVSVKIHTYYTIYLNCVHDTHLVFQFRQKEI